MTPDDEKGRDSPRPFLSALVQGPGLIGDGVDQQLADGATGGEGFFRGRLPSSSLVLRKGAISTMSAPVILKLSRSLLRISSA